MTVMILNKFKFQVWLFISQFNSAGFNTLENAYLIPELPKYFCKIHHQQKFKIHQELEINRKVSLPSMQKCIYYWTLINLDKGNENQRNWTLVTSEENHFQFENQHAPSKI